MSSWLLEWFAGRGPDSIAIESERHEPQHHDHDDPIQSCSGTSPIEARAFPRGALFSSCIYYSITPWHLRKFDERSCDQFHEHRRVAERRYQYSCFALYGLRASHDGWMGIFIFSGIKYLALAGLVYPSCMPSYACTSVISADPGLDFSQWRIAYTLFVILSFYKSLPSSWQSSSSQSREHPSMTSQRPLAAQLERFALLVWPHSLPYLLMSFSHIGTCWVIASITPVNYISESMSGTAQYLTRHKFSL